MSFAVEFRRDGAIVTEADGLPDRAAAKQLAEAEIVKHYAEIAIVIDMNGSGMEVRLIDRIPASGTMNSPASLGAFAL